MRELPVARRGLLFLLVVALVCVVGADRDAVGDEKSVLKPDRPIKGPATLADIGVRQLERLPWDTYIVRFNLSSKRPVSVSACYLMDDHLLVLSASGAVYCLDRETLEPRWVATLRARLTRPPTESQDHYVFLTKDNRGATWVEAYSRRNGSIAENFPRKLPYGISGGPAAAGAMAYIPSLGRPKSNKTVESVNLLSGRPGWGYHGTGMIMGDLAVDPDGKILVAAGDNGVTVGLATGANAPATENWIQELSGTVDTTPVVTPEHVIIGTWDGLLYNLNVISGEINWMRSVDGPVRKVCPWVLGEMTRISVPSAVEGAADIELERYEGIAFARNRSGLHALDLVTGEPLFTDANGGRPILRTGKWLMVRHRGGKVSIRDTSDEYAVKGVLDLGTFTLVPTNRTNGTFFAVTHDGGIVAALPK